MKRLLVVLLVAAIALSAGCVKEQPQITPDLTPLEAPTQIQIIKDITPQEAFNLIRNNEGNLDFVILDVRTKAEFESGHIENAINIDKNSEAFRDELNNLDKNKIYLVYCASGGRSKGAVAIMQELGFMTAYNMQGGISQWQQDGLPTVE
jgi:rhodanese-related sulfurtransferase